MADRLPGPQPYYLLLTENFVERLETTPPGRRLCLNR